MTSRTARTGLRLNGLLSLATGTLLTAAPGRVGDWLGVSIDGWLRALGIALLGHALVLAWVGTREQLDGWLRLNLAVIAPYPLMMIGLVVTGLVDRPLGQALVLLDGALVGSLAVMQASGVFGDALDEADHAACVAT